MKPKEKSVLMMERPSAIARNIALKQGQQTINFAISSSQKNTRQFLSSQMAEYCANSGQAIFTDCLKSAASLFPYIANPYAEISEQQSLDWVARFQLITEASAYRRLRATKFGWLVASLYPDASLEQLNVISNLTIYLFMLSDLWEQAGIRHQIEHLSHLNAQLLNVLKGANTTVSDTDDPLILALQDIRKQLLLQTNSEWFYRFVTHLKGFFYALTLQAINHTQGLIPQVNDYLKIRPLLSGFYIAYLLIEVAGQTFQPSNVLENVTVKHLTLAANNIMSWWNDIISFKKEQSEGDIHNLVWLLQNEQQLPLEAAISEALKLWSTEVNVFVDLEVQLIRQNPEDLNLKHYLSGIRHCIGGYLNWTLESGRYVAN